MTDCFNRLIGSRNMNGKLKTLLKGNQKLNVYRNTNVKKKKKNIQVEMTKYHFSRLLLLQFTLLF